MKIHRWFLNLKDVFMPTLTFTFFSLADLLEDLDNLFFLSWTFDTFGVPILVFSLYYIFKIQNVSLIEVCC